jgi:hypothetical protein
MKDPWETVDPHDPSGGIEKIFKKGIIKLIVYFTIW